MKEEEEVVAITVDVDVVAVVDIQCCILLGDAYVELLCCLSHLQFEVKVAVLFCLSKRKRMLQVFVSSVSGHIREGWAYSAFSSQLTK